MKISLIVAKAKTWAIGMNNNIPWSLPDDMKYFKATTLDKHVIMGRKNWESIPEKFRPLPKRTNWIISRNTGYSAHGAAVLPSLQDVLNQIEAVYHPAADEEVFVIGGGEIYKLALPLANKLYVTEIDAEIDGDVHFPKFDTAVWQEVSRQHHDADEKHAHQFDFVVYDRK